QQPHDFNAAESKPASGDSVAAKIDPGLGDLNVEQRLEYLRKQFSPNSPEPQAEPAARPAIGRAYNQPLVRRGVKSAIAFAIAAAVAWVPVQRLLQATSVEAVVNARTLTLRAPIDGVVSLDPADLAIGTTFPAGTPLLQITN